MKQVLKKIGNKISAIAIAIFAPVLTFAQTGTANKYDLSHVSGAITDQMPMIKATVMAIVGIIFIAGLVHIIIAFVNHSQNLKQIVMSYVGGFIAFAAIWSIL